VKNITYRLIRYVGGKFVFPFEKLGYSNKISKIENLPESHFYRHNSFFDSHLAIHKSYLRTSGWLESKSRNQSSRNGVPIPWITYPCFELLDSLGVDEMKIVEIGAGASTHYFASKALNVISYEFDSEYLAEIRNGIEENTQMRSPFDFLSDTDILEIESKYLDTLKRDIEAGELSLETAQKVNWALWIQDVKKSTEWADLIFIDGGPRTLVAKICSESEQKSKLIILDNSDREYEKYATSILESRDYVEIPFSGLGPLNPYSWTTSIFIRELSTLKKFPRSNTAL
jgi:predicted O-methyltransferase YrrM